jgi:hypothetical protein
MLPWNDSIQWEKYGKRFLQDYYNNNITMQFTRHLPRKDRSYEDHIESTTIVRKFVNIADIREFCYPIKWDVVNEDSNTLILTIESEWNRSNCSLSNAGYASAYSHLCQYGE